MSAELKCSVATGFVVLAAIFAAADNPTAQRQAFRGGVDLVSLSVTATNGNQRYVSDLTQEDFIVTENGVPQQVTFFAKSGVPLALALLIDTSASMEPNLVTAQDAAIGFARHIGPTDLAMIIDFDSGVHTAQIHERSTRA